MDKLRKITINEQGNLLLERQDGVSKPQYCPFGSEPGLTCGDWCPLFGNPEEVTLEANSPRRWHLQLNCGTGASIVGTLDDQRPSAEEIAKSKEDIPF